MSVVELTTSCPVKFEDLHEYAATHCYGVPNEEITAWRRLLKDIPIYRAAGICSAGEVGLFGLLTHVRRELVLVDHSYKSLAVAMLKYLALREYGWKKTHELFTGDAEALYKAITPLNEKLPEKIRAVDPVRIFRNNCYGLKREWEKLPPRILRKSHTKLDWVQFVHGDLTDLADKGPFGLLYLSNALEHMDRNRRSPLLEQIEKLVKPGGYVISCGRNDGAATRGWEKVNAVQGGEGVRWEYIPWTYTLYRLPSDVQQAVAA